MKRCKCEHWQICPTCYPQGFDEQGVRKPVEIPPSREELQRDIVSIREQVEKWKSLHESLTKLNEAQERRHEKQVEKLTDECVVLRASSRSKLETISSLELQVEKLTKERDALRSRRCEVCGYLEHEREHTGCLREQLAALAEQNGKMREALEMIVVSSLTHPRVSAYADKALSLPDLASPVLNRIRAEGMRMAADICSEKHSLSGAEEAIRARAAELEKTND